MKNRGFTLIELIVVIAIIAVLAAIIAPNAFKAIEKAKISASIADLQAIKTGSMSCYSDTGQWIAACTGDPAGTPLCSASLFIVNGGNGVTGATTTAGWDGPYLEKWPPQAKWAGFYNYANNTAAGGTIFCTSGAPTCSAAGERYSIITNVPQTAADKIDQQLEGSVSGTAGAVRYGTTFPGPINVLISRDGTVSP